MKWQDIKVFVSSTFNDMHAERNYLATEVFPELVEWCEKRRIRLTDIDLRWGVTKEDAESGNTVRACLECIDECRPFFLCLLGQRRGWVPDLSGEAANAVVYEYEGLRSKLGELSMTELEIEHATLAPMVRILSDKKYEPQRSNALFFFRNDPFGAALSEAQRMIYTNAGAYDPECDDAKLEECKEKIRNELSTFDYDCRWDSDSITEELTIIGDACRGRLTDFTVNVRPMKDVILDGLKELIEKEYPENIPSELLDPYDDDALEQHLYSQTACQDFMAVNDELKSVSEYLSQGPLDWAGGEGHALFVTGPEGSGKSSLLTKVWQLLRRKGIGALYRAIRVTEKSYTTRDLYLSIGNEAGLFRASDKKEDAGILKIDEDFLAQLKSKGFRVLILDGLERLQDIHNLVDTLKKIPGGFYLIVSSDNSGDWHSFEFHYKTLEIPGLPDEADRLKFVDNYLRRTLKQLDAEQKNMLVTSAGAGSPLFLKVVLNELRSFGSFAELNNKICSFGDTIEEAFAEVLRTTESESRERHRNDKLFPFVIGMLAFANRGLDEDELLKGLGSAGVSGETVRQDVRMIMRRVRPYIARAGRRYNIQLAGLRNAAQSRYADFEKDIRRALSDVFEYNLRNHELPEPGIWVNINGSDEILYQMEMAGDWNGIFRLLKDDEVFDKIDPRVYVHDFYIPADLERYKRGVFFIEDGSFDRNVYSIIRPLAFTIKGESEEEKEIERCLADIFLEKAREKVRLLEESYDKPYSVTCGKLYRMPDKKEYYRFRDLCFEAVQLTLVSYAHENRSLGPNYKDSISDGERRRFAEYANRARPVMRFAAEEFLSGQNGSSYTGFYHDLYFITEAIFCRVTEDVKRKLKLYPDGYRPAYGYIEDAKEWLGNFTE